MSPATLRHLALALGDEGRRELLEGEHLAGRILLAMSAAHDAAAFSIEEERRQAMHRAGLPYPPAQAVAE